MPTNLEKLRSLLQELFQLDQADLDFGIYRIMNQKREEIVRFLDRDLLPQVKEAFGQYKSADKSVLQGELDKLIASVQNASMNPDDSPKVKELRQKIAESAVDVTALENEVFSHLTNFFRRYYDQGDFISLRRYKAGVYAIPYEGEEVKLHWANADQYYVKSSEYFRDYVFTMPSGRPVRVHLVAASTEQDNNRPAPGKERRFFLSEEKPVLEENGELCIRFEYRQAEGKEKQDALNQAAIDRILKTPGFDEWMRELSKPAPTDKNKNRTILEKHLYHYTARNTFDYFIHKDLGGFLRRELDFYIKNEVMHLDDIEHDTAPRVEQYLSQIRVIRSIAHKIIAFLEQLENFQKRLWLKKKFVIEANYCITLDRVPEELYPEITKNDAQREEWVRLFAIDEIKHDLNSPGYTTPLKVDFLKANPFLVLDTAFFPRSFKDRLLASIHELDEQTDGLLFRSDNFHALNLLYPRFQSSIKCIYIDPPYNTGNDGFPYKDSYQHSSWISMLADRLSLGRLMQSGDGSIFISIDDGELANLRKVADSIYGPDNFIANVIWQKVYSPKNSAKYFSEDHDYVVVYAVNKECWLPHLLPRTEEMEARYTNPDNDPRGPWKPGDFSARNYYSEGTYPITCPSGRVIEGPPSGRYWAISKHKLAELDADGRIWWGPDGNNVPAIKRFLSEVKEGRVPQTLWTYKEVGHTQEAKKELVNMIQFETSSDVFTTPKPTRLLQRVLNIGLSGERDVVLDFFAGSGTAAHAAIASNREDNGKRKYIVVEMENYFDRIMKPRLAKAVYADQWEGGKPVSRKGVSHAFKYIRLESYDDALNNLELRRSSQQTSLLDADADLREQYVLSYMLDVESRGSQSLLNIESFRDPDQYKLKVERNGESQLVNVDLVETFNWLLGLTVRHIDVIRGVRVVEGTNHGGERVLVLWRNLDEMDSDKLDQWFEKQGYSTRDLEFDLIYVNGDNNLENLRRSDQTWKVRLIEEEFHRLMFDVQDV